MKKNITFCLLALAAISSRALAQDWPNWRGPNFNGSTEGKDLPVKFSPTNGVKWSVDLPGPSAGTPVVFGDHVFVSSCDTKNQTLVAICVNRKTGKVMWQQDVHSGHKPGGLGNRLQLDERSNYASPSPVTDGKKVYFYYGNGDLICFDMAGKKIWSRNVQKELGDFGYMWTPSSSVQLYKGKLYLQVLQRKTAVGPRGKDNNHSFLMAMNPDTGVELWRVIRPDDASIESSEAYSTPMPQEINGKVQILISGGDVLTGHDPETGKELWRWGTYNPGHREVYWRLVPSPVAGGGVALVCAPKRAPVYAVKNGQSGNVSDEALAWKSEDRNAVTTDVPTPLFYKGKFFVVSDVKKAISCVEPATGKVIWSTPLEGPMVWGSPTGADGKIYLFNLSGTVTVVDAAAGTILSANPMAEGDNDIRSSPVVAHNCLFLRTASKLYCVGK